MFRTSKKILLFLTPLSACAVTIDGKHPTPDIVVKDGEVLEIKRGQDGSNIIGQPYKAQPNNNMTQQLLTCKDIAGKKSDSEISKTSESLARDLDIKISINETKELIKYCTDHPDKTLIHAKCNIEHTFLSFIVCK